MEYFELDPIIKSYPILYQEAIKDMIKQTSKEFVLRYFIECEKKVFGWDVVREPFLYGSHCIRHAIEYYLSTGKAHPPVDYLANFSRRYPKLYLDKYGKKYLKTVMRRCHTKKWSEVCEYAMDFMIKHNVTLKDVSFRVSSSPKVEYGEDLGIIEPPKVKRKGWITIRLRDPKKWKGE